MPHYFFVQQSLNYLRSISLKESQIKENRMESLKLMQVLVGLVGVIEASLAPLSSNEPAPKYFCNLTNGCHQ